MILEQNEIAIINRFLDEQGRIKVWPAKRQKQEVIFKYLAQKFEAGRIYTENEINLVLYGCHTFNDHFLLRRGLVVQGHLERKRDGSAYWVKNSLSDVAVKN